MMKSSIIVLLLGLFTSVFARNSWYDISIDRFELSDIQKAGKHYTRVSVRQTCTSDVDFTHNDSGLMDLRRPTTTSGFMNVYKIKTAVCKKYGLTRRRACAVEVKFYWSNKVVTCGMKKHGDCLRGSPLCCGDLPAGYKRLDDGQFDSGSDVHMAITITPDNCPEFYKSPFSIQF